MLGSIKNSRNWELGVSAVVGPAWALLGPAASAGVGPFLSATLVGFAVPFMGLTVLRRLLISDLAPAPLAPAPAPAPLAPLPPPPVPPAPASAPLGQVQAAQIQAPSGQNNQNINIPPQGNGQVQAPPQQPKKNEEKAMTHGGIIDAQFAKVRAEIQEREQYLKILNERLDKLRLEEHKLDARLISKEKEFSELMEAMAEQAKNARGELAKLNQALDAARAAAAGSEEEPEGEPEGEPEAASEEENVSPAPVYTPAAKGKGKKRKTKDDDADANEEDAHPQSPKRRAKGRR